MQRRDTRKWNHYRTIENGFRSRWKVRVYTRLPADPLQKYLVREASVTLFFPLLKFWNNTTNTLPSTSIYTVKLFSQISPRLKILQNLNSIIPIFPLATRKISSRSSLEYPPFQQIFSRCTCVSRCSQPRESQIPPTSNLWLSRNTFQNTQPLLHQTFTSSITPLCIPFPIVAQYPGWKRGKHGRGAVRSNTQLRSKMDFVTKSHFAWSWTTTVNRPRGRAEKFWSKVSETRGDPDNLYSWNSARIRLSAASGATKNVKRETARVYAVCGDRRVELLYRDFVPFDREERWFIADREMLLVLIVF